ncbi:MAG: aldehyde dehydrogenase family protein [Rhodospirillales bacterium]
MGAGENRFVVNDPSNGNELGEVANLGPADARTAIAAAHAALPAWRGKTAKERHAVLIKWFQLFDGEPGRSGAHHHYRTRQAVR